MTDLSPAAQAVLEAGREYATQAWSDATHQRFNLGIAAALRATADQVVPATFFNVNGGDRTVWETKRKVRDYFLAIADELKGDE
jgi:hypothetical protein